MLVQKPHSHFFRNGLIFGAILAALGLANTLIQAAAGAYHAVADTTSRIPSFTVANTGPTALLVSVSVLATLALTFLAGLLTARSSGRAGSGALAGLVAGVVGSLFGSIVSIVLLILFVAPVLQAPSGDPNITSRAQTVFVVVAIGTAFLGLLLDADLGAGMGALGGLLGANRSPYRNTSGAPPMPQAPMPQAPGYPGTPAQPGPTPRA